jgi:SAM-dependent methyltransferase
MAAHAESRLPRWDERYGRGEELYGFVPSPPLPMAVEGLPPGRALDLACGGGRHALFLAERGWQVDAVDGSAVGLSIVEREADRRGLGARITTHRADLEADPPGFTLAPARYDLILDFYFLHRPLLAAVPEALRAGGRFVAAIHYEDPGTAAPHAFTLAPGELRATVEGWGFAILHAREGPSTESGHHHATAEIVARKPGLAP